MLAAIKYFFRKVDEFTALDASICVHGPDCSVIQNFSRKQISLDIKSSKTFYRIIFDGVVKVDWTAFDRNNVTTSISLYGNLDTVVALQFSDFADLEMPVVVRLPTWSASEIKIAKFTSIIRVTSLYLKRIKLYTIGKITSNNNFLAKSRAVLRVDRAHEQIEGINFNRNHLKFFNEAPITDKGECLIVLPAYNALELLKKCIQRVVDHTENYELLIIDDCSPDVDVAPYLKSLHIKYPDAPIKILRNKQNIGFVKTVNIGMLEAIKKNKSLIVLNSDALVPDDKWLSKLMHPINERPSKVASVTPLSNAATIMTVPFICHEHVIDESEIEEVNKAASCLSSRYIYPIPTGIGFCMAMNIEFIRQVPQLDEVFGHGYGEEVDWCQKVAANGGINVGITNLFVAHVGGQSFGGEKKRKAVANAGKIISSRYPSYDADVQNFIGLDAFAFARIVTGMRLYGLRKKGIKLYIGHNGTGGAQNYLDQKIKNETNFTVMIIRPCQYSCWRLHLVCGKHTTSCSIRDNDTVIELMKDALNLEIFYSCGVGHRNPFEIPKLIVGLKAAIKCHVTILYHDFFPISPSYNLLDDEAIYNLSAVIQSSRHSQWFNCWREAHKAADHIEVFSKNTQNIVESVYPNISDKITLRPHDMSHAKSIKPAIPRAKRRPGLTIGVLGNINIAKGGLVLQQLAKYYAKNDKDARIVIIGEVTPGISITRPSIVHGRYEARDINMLIDRYDIDLWFFPSIWPETFSYVIHECIATCLPVMCFNLGAQADAVEDYKSGVVLDHDYTDLHKSNIGNLSKKLVDQHHAHTCNVSRQERSRYRKKLPAVRH